MSRSEGPEELLTRDEVAEELKIRRKQVYGLIHNEGLPARRLNRRTYRIPRAEFDTWLASREPAHVMASKAPQ